MTRFSLPLRFASLLVAGALVVPPAVFAQASAIPADARYTAADVAFMRGMIGHHAQALEMSALVASRSTRPEIALLAERITVSQRDEIAIMARWLSERQQPVPAEARAVLDSAATAHDAHAGHAAAHAHDGHQMPGMLTRAQMDSLGAARGDEFDRRFLRYMIQHHEGALTMVAELLATPGAARETMVYQFAADVDVDQRSEIRRMKALLDRLAGR